MDRSSAPVSVVIWFHDGLDYFWKGSERSDQAGRRVGDYRSAVKDVIESCGIPHPEVDLILVNQQPVEFSFQIKLDCLIDVYPFSPRHCVSSRLQRRGVRTFIADGHLVKLFRDLPLLGIDVAYQNHADHHYVLPVLRRDTP